jgi:hypothetical protein
MWFEQAGPPGGERGGLRLPMVASFLRSMAQGTGKQSRVCQIRIILEHANEHTASFWDECNRPTRRFNNQDTDG